MANIREFDAGVVKLNPTETGVEAQAGTARRVGGFYSQQASAEETLARETSRLGGETQQLGRETEQLGSEVGSGLTDVGRRIGSAVGDAGAAAVQYLDAKQISHGAVAFTQLMLQKTLEWQKTAANADPNDPTVAARFMAGLNDKLQTFEDDGFYTEGGQKWAEAHVDALRQHMAEMTIGTMSKLAGDAADQNLRQTVNQLSGVAFADPTSRDFALATLKSSKEGLLSASPNLTAEQKGMIRTDQKGEEAILKSAAIGYIAQSGTVPPWASDPKYAPYINGAELKTFEAAAKAQAKSNELTQKQLEKTTRELNEGKAQDAANKLLTDNVKLEPATGRPIVGPDWFKGALEIAKMPNAPQGLARTLMDWGEHQQKNEDTVSDPTIRQQLFDGMLNNTKPINVVDVLRAQADGKVSNKDAALMKDILAQNSNGALNDPVFKGVMESAKGIVHQSLDGQENYAKFFYSFVRDYQKQSASGSLQPNALDLRDDSSLISQYLKQWGPTPAQKMQYHIFKNMGVNASDPDLLAKIFPNPTAADTPAPPKVDGPTAPALPPALKGLADTYHPETKQWSNKATGAVYDGDGKVQVPATSDRVAGQTYPTPKGKMKWTGTGWVAP